MELKPIHRVVALVIILLACTASAIYIDIIGQYGVLYALLFFIPIILAGMWFYRWAVLVAIFLGAVNIIAASFPFTSELVPMNELLRTTIFVVVAYAIGYINEQRAEGAKELEKLSTAVEQSIDPVYITDTDGTIEYVNPAFVKLTGYSEKDAEGNTPNILKSGKHDEEFYTGLWSTIQRGSVFRAEMIDRKKTGEFYHVERTITPIKDQKGNITHFVATGKDITDRKKLEEELRKHTEDLELQVRERTREVIQSEKMASLGVLVAGVAHEINNPLAYVKSNTEMALESVLELRESCRDADLETLNNLEDLMRTNSEGIERIAKITTTLRRFARMDTEHKALGDINQGIRDTLLIVQNQLKHRVKVHEDYGEIPKVMYNIGQINQVFMNIILNASEAVEKGDIWIRTWSADRYVHIEIRDNGVGMSADMVGKVFDPFFTTKDKGTGLGLTVSYKIIEEHKGHIDVQSEQGKGSKVTVRLPVGA